MRRKIRFDRSNGLKVDLERKIDSLINDKYLLQGIMGWCAKNMFLTMPASAFPGNDDVGYGLVDLGLMLFNALIFMG